MAALVGTDSESLEAHLKAAMEENIMMSTTRELWREY
jgi:hypothetical protein